jgi:tripartite-type tricarboxylate transporter receptor subunit TctC
MMLTTSPAIPARTVKELIALAKASPGKLNYGSSGIGGIPHLTAELFNRAADITMHHVPYKGGGTAMPDLISGHIQVYVQSVVQGAAMVKDGRVRALAILGPKRSQVLPDVPTMSETLPGYEATNWYGLVVPSATPAAVQRRIYGDLAKVLRMPDIRNGILAQGAVPLATPPDEFAVFLKSEIDKWARIIKDANISAD